MNATLIPLRLALLTDEAKSWLIAQSAETAQPVSDVIRGVLNEVAPKAPEQPAELEKKASK